LIERILLIGILIHNIIPNTWTIFLAFFYVYKRSFSDAVSFSTLYFATALLRISTFLARNVRVMIHSMLGLKRTIQLIGLLYLLNFLSFYKFPSCTCFYINSVWLGFLNGILTSTILTYIRDKQEATRAQAEFYSLVAYYISFTVWALIGLAMFNLENRPIITPDMVGFNLIRNRENFRTLMDVFGTVAVLVIESFAAFLEDPIKYNPAFQEWLNTKLNEEREGGDNIEMNDAVAQKRIIGHMDDESISNVHNNRMDNRISGNTLFTYKTDVKELVSPQNAERKTPAQKTDNFFIEDELPISVSFLNAQKEDSDQHDNYDVIARNTINGQNFFLIFAINTLRLVSLNFFGFAMVVIGLNIKDDTHKVIGTLLIGFVLKLFSQAFSTHLPKIINLHKVYLLNIILNIGMSLMALNSEHNFNVFFVFVCLQKILEGAVYSFQGSIGNYLYEFEKKEIATSLFELESVTSAIIGALAALLFVDELDFQTVFKAFVGLDVVVLVLFFYLVSTKF